MANTPFYNEPQLTELVQDYGNCPSKYVADCVLPRINIGKSEYEWLKFSEKDSYEVFNAFAGDCAQVHEITPKSSQRVQGKVKDYALDVKVPQGVLQDSLGATSCDSAGYNYVQAQVMNLVDKLRLARELRTAALVFDPTLYPAAKTDDLAGTEFNAADDATSPLDVIGDLLVSDPKARLNWAVMNRKVFHVIRRHPDILGNTDLRGMASLEAVAAQLGLDGICIADTQFDTAINSLPVALQDVWNNGILLFNRFDGRTTDCPESHFGFTAQETFSLQENSNNMFVGAGEGNGMGLSVGRFFDPKAGQRGSWYYRAAESVDENVVDYTQGFLLTNVIV